MTIGSMPFTTEADARAAIAQHIDPDYPHPHFTVQSFNNLRYRGFVIVEIDMGIIQRTIFADTPPTVHRWV